MLGKSSFLFRKFSQSFLSLSDIFFINYVRVSTNCQLGLLDLISLENIQKLIIITGKGIHSNNKKDPYKSIEYGILKHSVPDFIKKEGEK